MREFLICIGVFLYICLKHLVKVFIDKNPTSLATSVTDLSFSFSSEYAFSHLIPFKYFLNGIFNLSLKTCAIYDLEYPKFFDNPSIVKLSLKLLSIYEQSDFTISVLLLKKLRLNDNLLTASLKTTIKYPKISLSLVDLEISKKAPYA